MRGTIGANHNLILSLNHFEKKTRETIGERKNERNHWRCSNHTLF